MPVTISRNVDAVIQTLAVPDLPTHGDMAFVGLQQRTRILRRTAAGVDVEGVPFKAYSRRGPFYYYPSRTKAAGGNVKAARRLAKKLGLTQTTKQLGGRGTPFGGVTPGGGIKYRSYAEFKASLGRGGSVDLRGPRSPHMLQSLVVRLAGTGDIKSKGGGQIGLPRGIDIFDAAFSNATPVSEVRVGIYGEAAARASGHQSGVTQSKLPKRRFLGANREDQQLAARSLEKRRLKRITDRLKGQR